MRNKYKKEYPKGQKIWKATYWAETSNQVKWEVKMIEKEINL